MTKVKIAVTVNLSVPTRLDAWAQSGHHGSSSEAIEKVVVAQLQRPEWMRLLKQCALLDADEEQALADSGLVADTTTWLAF